MSLSKYTDLPDIDTAGQDLYETPEVPSPGFSDDDTKDLYSSTAAPHASGNAARRSNQNAASSTTAGGGLAQPSIDIESATAKFRRATEADGRGSDFSGALHRVPRRPAQVYPTTLTFETDTYEIRGYSSTSRRRNGADKGEDDGAEGKETPLEKLRRLRAETQALEDELAAQADRPQQDGTGEDGAHRGGAAATAEGSGDGLSPIQILEQLRKLRADLGKLDADETGTAPSGRTSWEADARALIQKLGGPKSGSGQGARETAAAAADGTATANGTAAGTSKEQVQLETRLASLENLVGIRPALVDESKAPARPLLSTMQRLEHQLTLFTQPRHLDAISRRVKVLVAELERAHEAKSKLAALAPAPSAAGATAIASAEQQGGEGASGADGTTGSGASNAAGFGTPDQLARLRSLFVLQTRLEPLLPLAPHLLSRLQSLAALHSSAAHFGASLEQLVEADARLGERAGEIQELCRGLESSMEEDGKRIKTNLELVQARMEALGKRMEALGV